MTARERAKPLGWVREEGWWHCVRWVRRDGGHSVVAQFHHDAPWAVNPWGRHVQHHRTEDEALAHALLLLDVWLS